MYIYIYKFLYSQEYYDNQFGTYMLIDVEDGFAPPEWQSYVGPVLAYRPQIGGQSVQHFNSKH